MEVKIIRHVHCSLSGLWGQLRVIRIGTFRLATSFTVNLPL